MSGSVLLQSKEKGEATIRTQHVLNLAQYAASPKDRPYTVAGLGGNDSRSTIGYTRSIRLPRSHQKQSS